MAIKGTGLFYQAGGPDLSDVLRSRLDALRQAVQQIAETEFVEQTDEELATSVAVASRVEPLEVDFDAARSDVAEAQVEVRDMFGGGVILVPGLEVAKIIPFKGDPGLWFLRPNPWTVSVPHGEIRSQHLLIGAGVRVDEGDRATQHIDSTIATICDHLRNQSAQITQHNDSLAGHVLPLIQQRRSRLSAAADLRKRLGGS